MSMDLTGPEMDLIEALLQERMDYIRETFDAFAGSDNNHIEGIETNEDEYSMLEQIVDKLHGAGE